MSTNVIADVGDTLIKLLQREMADMVTVPSSIALHSPAELAGSTTRLTLFLYNVLENPYMRYQDGIFPQDVSFKLPPLILDLHYMLTAYSSLEDLTDRTLEEHRLLGRAMSILHNHASLRGADQQGDLAGGEQDLRITLNPVTVSELSDIWTAFTNLNLRPSVCYIVSPLIILPEPLEEAPAERVKKMELKFAAPLHSNERP